jgi:hypothetical protein
LEADLEVEYARDVDRLPLGRMGRRRRSEHEGTAELLDDGMIEIEFAYDNWDEVVLKAKRMTSSTACSHVRRQGF